MIQTCHDRLYFAKEGIPRETMVACLSNGKAVLLSKLGYLGRPTCRNVSNCAMQLQQSNNSLEYLVANIPSVSAALMVGA